MAYNRRNLLEKIIEIQDVYTKHKVHEATHIGVYRMHIYPRFKISKTTLENYLQIPARAELKKLDAKAAEVNTTQLSMFTEIKDDETDETV